jgi:hypothetical protein
LSRFRAIIDIARIFDPQGHIRNLCPKAKSHIVPRSRDGKDAWEDCVWSSKAVNSKKGNLLPHEAGLKLLKQPVAVREMPVTALIRNTHGIQDWEPFVKE